MSVLFPQFVPPSPSPTVSTRLPWTCFQGRNRDGDLENQWLFNALRKIKHLTLAYEDSNISPPRSPTILFFFNPENIFFSFIFISWRLITLQYCSGFCHTLTWISRGVTCVPHPDPPSHLPLHPIPLGLPSAPGPSTYLMHPTWAGDLFHYR